MMRQVWLVGLAITIAMGGRAPAEAYEIFFLSVGNSHYRDEDLQIPDANVSAREIARYLRRAGAVDGITLLSERGAYVTRGDVHAALREIVGKAEAAQDPLVFYYFIGHGGSRGEGWTHVSFVGEYERAGDTGRTRTESIIETQEIEDYLEDEKVPYIAVLDNCYYRQPEPGVRLFARQVTQTFFDLGRSIDRIPADLGGAGEAMAALAFYAAEPGQFVETASHPWSSHSIGPLARRLLLLFATALEGEREIRIGEFLEQMNDGDFDPASAVGHHTAWITNRALPLIPARPRIAIGDVSGLIRGGSGGSR